MRRLVCEALPAAEPPEEGAPESMVTAVRTWARRGIDLRGLMRGYRATQTAFWRYWMADVTARIADPDLRAAVLAHSWEQTSAWFEHQLGQLETIYTKERDRWLRGAQARRAELVHALLAGETVDRERATAGLGYDLRRQHTALVLWTQLPDALGVLEEAVSELARAAGGGATLTLSAGPSTLWAWIATDAELPRRDFESAQAVYVAAGRRARGVDGFRTSHLQAQLVRREMPAGVRLATFGDVGLACLMTGEPELMRRLVADELGGLAQRDPNVARLRETARVYLACGANAREAAERLHMHKNTVHYRLARAEELRGRPIGERRLELEVALNLAHTLGDRVLPD